MIETLAIIAATIAGTIIGCALLARYIDHHDK